MRLKYYFFRIIFYSYLVLVLFGCQSYKLTQKNTKQLQNFSTTPYVKEEITSLKKKYSNNDIQLISVTIREGIESQISLEWPLKDSNRIFSSKYFLQDQELASKAGVNLASFLDKKYVAGYNRSNKNIFVLFYNFAKAPKCDKNYLIQKVRLDKFHYNSLGNRYKETYQYLVEIMKLNNAKSIKKADQHIRRYSLQGAKKRKVTLEAEVGCGEIPNQVQGREWPYQKNILYYRLQDYSSNPGYYNQVKFESSAIYRMEIEFDANGNYTVHWPEFVRQSK